MEFSKSSCKEATATDRGVQCVITRIRSCKCMPTSKDAARFMNFIPPGAAMIAVLIAWSHRVDSERPGYIWPLGKS